VASRGIAEGGGAHPPPAGSALPGDGIVTGRQPDPAAGERAATGARRFLAVFFGAVTLGLAAVAGLHMALAGKGLLPAPPITATNCINEKFVELREGLPLRDRTILAVGSSATWRNLDLSVFERRFPGARPVNAAPCYIHVDQTAFLTGFLLARMPRVETVLVVVAPRDFEECSSGDTAFFEPRLADAYLSGYVPAWLPYLTGFRPRYVLGEALRRHRERRSGEVQPAAMALSDRYGSSILRQPYDWRPALQIDRRCFDGLAALEAAVAARGAHLVVATVPIMPEWAAAFDPEGTQVEAWVRDIRASLRLHSSLFVDGRGLPWDNSRFADPVHLIYPHHRAYSEFLADAIARRQPPRMAGLEGA
jgi:hypothetical protein